MATDAGHLNGQPRSPATNGPPGQPLSERDWLMIKRILDFSPQQLQIARMIREEDLGNQAMANRLGCSARAVETQIKRMYQKINEAAAECPERGPEIHTRAALVDRIWVEFWRLRAGKWPARMNDANLGRKMRGCQKPRHRE